MYMYIQSYIDFFLSIFFSYGATLVWTIMLNDDCHVHHMIIYIMSIIIIIIIICVFIHMSICVCVCVCGYYIMPMRVIVEVAHYIYNALRTSTGAHFILCEPI